MWIRTVFGDIDQLLTNEGYDEAIPLIKKICETKAKPEKEIIAGINRQLDSLEKRFEIKK